MARQIFLLLLLFLKTTQIQTTETRSDDTDPLLTVVEQLSKDVSSLQAQLTTQKAEFESRIAQLEATSNRTVAFSAYISDSPNVAASQGSIVPFRHVISNIGGAYNPSTSVFTAPIDGHYFFIVHADCSADYRSLLVTLNGHRVFSGDNDGGDRHVTGSGLLKLKAGDVVSTSHLTSTGFVDAGTESTFTGFFVK